MTLATSSAQGEIKLAGDLAGSTDANAPELITVLSAPGTFTVPTVTIDAKGRTTAASSTSTGTILSLIPDATTTVKGIASVGAGIDVSLGALSIPDASASVRGIFTVGSGLTMSAGQLSVDPTTLPDATSSVRGVASVGEGLSALSGVLSIAPATTTTRGGLIIGSGLDVDGAGVVSVAASLPAATNTVPGAVTSANTSNITITAGAVDVGPNIAKLNANNVFTKSQVVARVSPTFSSSITLDFSLGNVFYITPNTSFTMNQPTNVVAGGTYIIVFFSSVGNIAPTWHSSFKFGPGAIKVLSSSSGRYDIFTVTAISSTALLTTSQIGFI